MGIGKCAYADFCVLACHVDNLVRFRLTVIVDACVRFRV